MSRGTLLKSIHSILASLPSHHPLTKQTGKLEEPGALWNWTAHTSAVTSWPHNYYVRNLPRSSCSLLEHTLATHYVPHHVLHFGDPLMTIPCHYGLNQNSVHSTRGELGRLNKDRHFKVVESISSRGSSLCTYDDLENMVMFGELHTWSLRRQEPVLETKLTLNLKDLICHFGIRNLSRD